MPNHITRTSFSRLGPAFLVYLGCMDPGRWATAMEAGSRLGLELVWVLISACAFSAFLQSLSNRLGLATGKNLAQICGDEYPRYLSTILWFQCEVSILILDLSTVLGIAIILNSLLGFSMISSVIIAAAKSIILLLFLPHLGLYKAALLIASIMGVVLLSFTAETLYNNISSAPAAFQGLIPMFRGEIIYIAAGILGSNILPTNIYLQSALFENGKFQDSQKSGLTLRYSAINITAASGTLFLVILAVLSSAAAIFHNSGHVVVILQDAQALMEQVLSNSVSPVAFGFSFICASQISTLSGTMAGQVAAQGLLGLKLPFMLHHIFTRLGATVAALFLVWSFGSEGVYQILIFLQVILTLQLPFVIVPLVKITSSQSIMGNYKNSLFVETISWICLGVIYVVDVWVMFDLFFGEYDEYMISGSWNFLRDLVELSTKWGEVVRFLCCITTVGLATSSTLLLMWMISTPFKVQRTKQLMRSVSAPMECIPEISEGNMEAKKTFQEFDLYNDHVLTEVAKTDRFKALEADELANDPCIMSMPKVVEEVQLEDIQLECAENLTSPKEPFVEAKAEVSTSSVDNITFLLCNQEQEIQSKTNMKEIPGLVSTPISGDTFPSVNSCSKILIPSLVPSSEPNKIDQHDAGKSDANRDIEHPKQTDEEVDSIELFDKDDDYIDGWETLEQDNVFQKNPSILGDSVNSSTLEEPGSEKSFSARSDASESSCGGSGSGSLSRLSGLGRSARRQFSGLLDEFWGKLYDLHGQTVALPQGKPRVHSFKASQMDTLGYYPSVGYNDTFGNLHTSKFAPKSWHMNAMGDVVDPALHSTYPSSPSDSLDSLYPQSYSSHNLEARRYSSLNFPSSRDNVDNQPHTIHGYKMASYAERSRTFSMGLDVSPFIVERQRPVLHEQTSHAATFNRLQVSSSSGFESNLSSKSSQSKFPGPYAKQRLFGNSSLASNAFHNQAELLDMSRGTHRMPYTGLDASVWDPLVYRVTGELNIPHNDHKIVQLGEKDIVSPSYTQQPVSRGYFGINTNDSEGFKSQVETPLSFDERAPLSFDEISPPQSRKDAFSIQSSSLWSTQPFEQLFGSSHSSTSVSPSTTDMTVSQSGTLSSLILANDHDITILNALRICIRKLLKLDGSDWLFRLESGLDEDLIGTVAKREKVLLDADAKELYKVQALNEQFLVAGPQKQFTKSDVDPTLAASGVPHCGEGCVWSMELVVSFGVWCIHRILELALMESRPELWGKYTYVLNRLQGVLDPAFSKPRTISTSCICVISEVPDVKQCIMKDVGETGFSASTSQSWPWGNNPSIPKGKGASANVFLDIIRVVEMAIGSRKGRTGTAAGDVAFPKGKENLASVLKRYKRRLSSKSLGTTGNVNYSNNISSGVSNHRALAVNPLLCRS